MPYTAYDATLGTLTLRQVMGADFQQNGEPVEGLLSGGVDVGEYFGGEADQRATFETGDLAGLAAVANFGTAGLGVTSGTVSVPYQARQNLATYAASGHFALTASNAFIYPKRFSVKGKGPATAELEAVFVSADGDTNPVAVNVSASLVAQAFTGLYGLGPVSVNGTLFDRVDGWTVEPGIEIKVEFYGRNYVREVFIVKRRPKIEIMTFDLETLSALGSAWGVGASLVCFARKRAGISWAADAATEHASFSFADGIVKPYAVQAREGEHGQRTLTYFGETLVVTGGVAIE